MARNLVFLAVNASFSHTNLAEWYLQGYADPALWNWHTVEFANGEELHSALAQAMQLQPDVLATTAYLFNRTLVFSFLRRFKALCPRTVVIAGGPEFLGDNRRLLAQDTGVDRVVRGEGELAFAEWLRHFEDADHWMSIAGLCGYRDGRYIDNGLAQELADLDEIPSPYVRRLPGFSKPFVQVETSRGCANTCAFCTSGRSGGVRYFSLARIRRDLQVIQAHGVRQVKIVDRTFNDRPVRARRLLTLFRQEFPGLWFHLEIDPARTTPGLIRELKAARAGEFHLELGLQTLNEDTYRAIGRKATARRSLSGTVQLCAIAGVETHADLIAGLPCATVADLQDDLGRLVPLRPGEIQLEVLKLLPGTGLDTCRAEWGLVAAREPPYEILQTNTMSFAEVECARGLSRLVDWFYNTPALQAVTIEAAATVPGFWNELLAFVQQARDQAACPSLANRFVLLDRFLQAQSSPLVNRVRYQWLKCGFSARQGLCTTTPWKQAIPARAVLVEGAAPLRTARILHAVLETEYLFVFAAGEGAVRSAAAVYRLP